MPGDAPLIYSIDQAPPLILAHLAVAMAALTIGAIVLLRRKGTHAHRLLGRAWVVCMLAASVSSLFIQARGRFSLIHIFSVLVLIVVPLGMYLGRTHRVKAHGSTMVWIYVSLCITGLFTLLPYRMLGQLIFGKP
jgi:uncharacterized membrane protein